jgi:hypothetical protein
MRMPARRRPADPVTGSTPTRRCRRTSGSSSRRRARPGPHDSAHECAAPSSDRCGPGTRNAPNVHTLPAASGSRVRKTASSGTRLQERLEDGVGGVGAALRAALRRSVSGVDLRGWFEFEKPFPLACRRMLRGESAAFSSPGLQAVKTGLARRVPHRSPRNGGKPVPRSSPGRASRVATIPSETERGLLIMGRTGDPRRRVSSPRCEGGRVFRIGRPRLPFHK